MKRFLLLVFLLLLPLAARAQISVTGNLSMTGNLLLTGNSNQFHASGSAVTTTTAGSTSSGSTSVTVASGASFSVDQGIYIAGAGTAGANYIGTVSVVSGDVLTITPATGTTVANGTKVQHDDTAAFQAAIDYIDTLPSGSGTIWVPDGYYRLNGPLQDPSGANAILNMPDNAVFVDGVVQFLPVIAIRGLTPPGVGGNYNTATQTLLSPGAVLQTDATAGNLIGGYTTTGYVYHFTNVHLIMENLILRSYDNPQITMINASKIHCFEGIHLYLDTGVTAFATQPTYPNGVGINMGDVSNAMTQRLTNVSATGYYTGIKVSEHTRLDNVILSTNLISMEIKNSSYPITGSHVVMNGYLHGIVVEQAGLARTVNFSDWVLEPIGYGWAGPSTEDILDPGNYLRGIIYFRGQDIAGGAKYQPKLTGAKNVTLIDLTFPLGDSVAFPAGGTTVTIAAPQITARSRITVMENMTKGTALGVTCNTTQGRTYSITTMTVATGFVITASAAPVTNPACLDYRIEN